MAIREREKERESVTGGVAVGVVRQEGVEEGGIEGWPVRLSSQNHFMSRIFFKSILLDCWFNGSGNIVDEDLPVCIPSPQHPDATSWHLNLVL